MSPAAAREALCIAAIEPEEFSTGPDEAFCDYLGLAIVAGRMDLVRRAVDARDRRTD